MNFRLTAIFFGLVLALVVGLLVLVLTDPGKDGLGTDTLLPELRAFKEKEIDAVEFTRAAPVGTGEEKLVFARTGEAKWELKEPFAAKVDSFLIESVVRDLVRLKPTAYGDLSDNLTLHGLDKPTYRVALKKGDKVSGLNVGFSTLGTRPVTFLTTSGNPSRTLAVLRSDLASLWRESAARQEGEASKLAKWLADFRVRKPLGSDLRDASLEVTGLKLASGPQEFTLARPPSAGWGFTSPANFGEAEEVGDSAVQPPTAALTGVRPLLMALTAMQVASVEDYLESPGDLAQYGLTPGDPNAVRVELTGKAGVEAITLGKPVEAGGKPVTPAKVYAKIDGDSGVMMVTFDRLEAVKATIRNPGELRNKDLLAESARGKIDAIDLTVGATLTRLRRVSLPGEPTPQWVIYGGPAPVTAKTVEVEKMLAALSKPRIVREVLSAPYDPVFADADKKATVRAWTGGLEAVKPPAVKLEPGQYPAEPIPAGTPLELTFGKTEGDIVYVRRVTDGKSADVKVPEALAAAAAKSRGDLIDPKFRSFTPATVSRVTFNRGAEAFDFEKDAAGTWVFAKPDAAKGRPADAERFAGLVAQLSALTGRVVNEAPTPDDLKKLGLDPAAPRLRATLAVQDPVNKDRVFEFGNDADEGRAVVVRQPGRPFVVQAPHAAYAALATLDLRDRTLYALDPAKVKRLKIRGWRAGKGAVTTYQLDRGPTGWAATAPAGVAVDPGKVEQLVAALSKPRVETYVGEPKAEHGVSIDANPDAFEFTLESDGAPTVALVLGSKADGGKVFATASTTPNLIGVFDASVIRPLIEKPESLGK